MSKFSLVENGGTYVYGPQTIVLIKMSSKFPRALDGATEELLSMFSVSTSDAKAFVG